MRETKFIIDREVTINEVGDIDISKTNFKPYTGGALKLARSFGYLTDWEVLTIQALTRGLPEKAIVVNVGGGAGTSGLAMAEACGDLIPTIYTVDLYEDRGPLGGLLSERNAFATYNTPLVNQIQGDSSEVGKAWDKGPIDLIFVDGDHSAAGVERDINAWLPHMKNNGLMLFHDFQKDQWAQVKPTVERLMLRHRFLWQTDYIGIYQVIQPTIVDAPTSVRVKRPKKEII